MHNGRRVSPAVLCVVWSCFVVVVLHTSNYGVGAEFMQENQRLVDLDTSFPFNLTVPTSMFYWPVRSPNVYIYPRYPNGTTAYDLYFNFVMNNITLAFSTPGNPPPEVYDIVGVDSINESLIQWNVSHPNTNEGIIFTASNLAPGVLLEFRYDIYINETELYFAHLNGTVPIPAGSMEFTIIFDRGTPVADPAQTTLEFNILGQFSEVISSFIPSLISEANYVQSQFLTQAMNLTTTFLNVALVDSSWRRFRQKKFSPIINLTQGTIAGVWIGYNFTDFVQYFEYDPNLALLLVGFGQGGDGSAADGESGEGLMDGGFASGGDGNNNSLKIGLIVGLLGGAVCIVVIAIIVGLAVVTLRKRQNAKLKIVNI